MKVLVIQNKVYENIDDTLTHILEMIDHLKSSQIDIIVLPEMFTTPYELKYMKQYQQTLSGEVLTFLHDLAQKYNSYVIGGSVPYFESNKLYNSTFIFDRDGIIIERYDKIHLFEITYPDGTYFSEAKLLTKGNKVVTFDTEFGVVGVMICFDIRFPLLANTIMKKDAKIIFVPAAFNTYTGPLHWRTTFRARAIDNQLFMVGCSPSRDSFGDYHVYGHSLIVNPFGEVLNELAERKGYFIMDINLDDVQNARERIPIIKNSVSFGE